MPKGNARDPFTVTGGLDWSGNSKNVSGFEGDNNGGTPDDAWGPADAASVGHLDNKANRRPDRESRYSMERTVLDRSRWPSDALVKRTSAQQYSSNSYKDDTK
jgi:hypothetical protein